MQQEISTFSQRLQRALDLRGVGKAALARACGYSPSTVTQWLSGETKTFDAGKIVKTARHLRVRVEWLVDGEEPMESSELHDAAAELVESLPSEPTQMTLDFIETYVRRSFADNPITLGHYLKLLDRLRNLKR